jgi:hypothetical protein
MGNDVNKEIDLGEYVIIIKYIQDGDLEIEVLDELGSQIEGIYISNIK